MIDLRRRRWPYRQSLREWVWSSCSLSRIDTFFWKKIHILWKRQIWTCEGMLHRSKLFRFHTRGYIYVVFGVCVPVLWSRTSWIAFPPSIWRMWDSDHAALKSSANVVGLAEIRMNITVKTVRRMQRKEVSGKEGKYNLAIGTLY